MRFRSMFKLSRKVKKKRSRMTSLSPKLWNAAAKIISTSQSWLQKQLLSSHYSLKQTSRSRLIISSRQTTFCRSSAIKNRNCGRIKFVRSTPFLSRLLAGLQEKSTQTVSRSQQSTKIKKVSHKSLTL